MIRGAMAISLARNFLLFVAVVPINTMSSSNCKFLMQELGCWASCELGSCGKCPSDPDSFTQCSWTFKSPNETENYNFTSYLRMVNNQFHGSEKKECRPSVAECDATSGICYAKFLLPNCTVIKEVNELVRFDLTAIDGNKEVCSEHVNYKICQHAKPRPPVITEIKEDQKNQKIRIGTSHSTCPRGDLKVRLNYTRSNGVRTSYSEEITSPDMRYKEASMYNYTLEYSKEENVFSDPANGIYLTKPEKACQKRVRMLCLSKNERMMNASMSWEHDGIINHFSVSISEKETGDLLHNKTVMRNLPNQTAYQVVAEIPLDKPFNFSIVAYNGAGKSKVYRKSFTQGCQKPLEISHCSVKSKGHAWMEVEWDTKNDKYRKDENRNFEVEFSRNRQRMSSGSLSFDRRKYNMTDLQECVNYEISVCLVYDRMKQDCCKVEKFTKGRAPQISADTEVTKAARNIIIRLQGESLNITHVCGERVRYKVKYSLEGDGAKKTKHFTNGLDVVTLSDLNPNSKYVISVVAFSNNGNGKNASSYIVLTSEAAPDDPPEITGAVRTSEKMFVSWNPPRSLHGNVTHYHVLFHFKERKSVRFAKEDGCHEDDEGYVCIYDAEIHSTTLHGVDAATNVSIRACAVNGSRCSEWSEMSKLVVKYEEKSPFLLIILCTVCGFMLVLVVIAVVIYRCRAQGSQPPKPRLPPELQKGFEERLLNDNAGKGSRDEDEKL